VTTADQLEQLYILVFSSLLAIALLVLAKKKRFFVLPPPPSYKEAFPSGKQVLLAFCSYFFLTFIFFPLLFLGVSFVVTGKFSGITSFPFIWQNALQQGALVVICLWFIAYIFLIKKEARELILWGGKRISFQEQKKSVGIGLIAFVVSYPLMMITSILFKALSYALFKKSGVQQVAVEQLKLTLDHPLLFTSMVFIVICVVPFVEELLFRGFLQSWLKRYMRRSWAITITSLIFSVVHFSPSQGVGNIELIAALFVLACFLGFIYERQKNLIAPIVMHAAFNGFSALMIALVSK
jgi:membrane protease YdiL (CAAX protease family)